MVENRGDTVKRRQRQKGAEKAKPKIEAGRLQLHLPPFFSSSLFEG